MGNLQVRAKALEVKTAAIAAGWGIAVARVDELQRCWSR